MAIVVKFENPPGNVLQTRQFTPGQELRIGGHVTDITGLSIPLLGITLDILSSGFSPISMNTTTTILGDFWFDIILPSVESTAVVKIYAEPTLLTGGQTAEIPIAIGNILPPPIEPPGTDTPWTVFLKYAPWIAAALGALYLYSVLPKGRLKNPTRRRKW